MRQLTLFAALLCLPGCWSIRSLFGLPPLPPTPKTNPFSNDAWADGLSALFMWGNIMSVVIIAACMAIIFTVQIPSLKKWAVTGIVFAVTMLAMGVTFAVMRPYIPFIIMGAVVIGIAGLIWYLIVNFDTIKQFVHKDKEDLTPAARNIVEVCQNLPQKTNS